MGSVSEFRLISPAFKDGRDIPRPYTCKGQGVNPPLNIIGTPKANSLALIMHDPDAVSGDFTHWLVWDIPASTENIVANSVPVGAMQGKNDAGSNSYFGPCPSTGTGSHRYVFILYALDKNLSLPNNSNRQDLERSMEGHILATSTLIGMFSAE